VVIFTIISNVIGAIVSILLIIGAVLSIRALLIPYVVFSVIGMVLFVVTMIVLLVLINDTITRIITVFATLISLPLPIYFCLAIIGLYKQQKAENQSAKRQNSEAKV
jgi:membrane protein implicated in regulation of membrane protease activity